MVERNKAAAARLLTAIVWSIRRAEQSRARGVAATIVGVRFPWQSRDPGPTTEQAVAFLDEQIMLTSAMVTAFESWSDVAQILQTSTLEEATKLLQDFLNTTELGAQQILNTQIRRVTVDERNRLRSYLDQLRAERRELDHS